MISLVTGVAGFIGSHLCEELLKNGHNVIGIDCFTDYYSRKIKERNLKECLKNKKFKFIEKDILDLDISLNNIDTIFHLAAQPGVRASWERFRDYVRNNILVTQHLLECCKNSKIKKFIFASSSSVYGDQRVFPITEKSETKPISPYGITKLAAEYLCQVYQKNYSVPIVILRYFTVYGERERPDMAIHKFINYILRNEEIVIYGNGEQKRDFTYVKDAVNATILASKANPGEVFNIAGGSATPVNKIIKILEELTGKKARIKYIEKQKGDVQNTIADISKAKKLLGYEPKVSIREGLRKQIEYQRDDSKV